jgi:hypothetical protein
MEDMEVVSWDDPLGEYTKAVISEFHKIPVNFLKGATSATWKSANSMSAKGEARPKDRSFTALRFVRGLITSPQADFSVVIALPSRMRQERRVRK